MSHKKSKTLLTVMAAISAMTFYAASAEDMKFSASAIGRPPIFSNTFVDVGEAKGYWKKAGLDMNFRWFQRGTDTAKAVVTGDVQVGYTATPPAVNLIASGAPIVAIAGMPNQDWVIASNEAKDCKDLKGKTVANQPLVKAGIADQVHSAVWHIDELAQVEHKTGKKWALIPVPKEIYAGLHYAVLITSKKAIQENREGVIRFLVGWIQTQKLMRSKKPEDQAEFAKIAAEGSQIDLAVAKSAIVDFQKLPYWVDDDGLNQKQLMAQVDQLVKVGVMKAENKPSYDKIVDKSLYIEAAKRVASMK